MRRPANPFAVLGLDPSPDLSDADVLVAWRRIAAATHPDRADGGDPGRFAAAAAAYTELRTSSGRGEARADLRRSRGIHHLARTRRSGGRRRAVSAVHGRLARIALRLATAGAAATAGVLAAGQGPAGPALAVGALTWLVVTARRDLAPPPRTLRATSPGKPVSHND